MGSFFLIQMTKTMLFRAKWQILIRVMVHVKSDEIHCYKDAFCFEQNLFHFSYFMTKFVLFLSYKNFNVILKENNPKFGLFRFYIFIHFFL